MYYHKMHNHHPAEFKCPRNHFHFKRKNKFYKGWNPPSKITFDYIEILFCVKDKQIIRLVSI